MEELVDEVPESIGYLIEKGVQAIACGAPTWDTLEQAARKKGFTDQEIDEIVEEIRRIQREEAKPDR